ncbi:addiction module toxin RelE [Lichenibacterium minor]|uniref:Addiction module toxin RelE n=1 Tax=Lichenibacterium minor TaxID=2316528 RepID=A0A4Q2TZI4_9HYPH|nr:type II toxin-antitoxin system RelE/ParE family toxin [Lichenibacterium minor]RYC29539.1 addiction module toxin RelE [Lichenibacterium minor]
MPFTVLFDEAFEADFDKLPEAVQDQLLARTAMLEEFGPGLGRPYADTLNGSSYPNMKELRFQRDGVWRFAYAWDPQRQAIVLCGGNKEGANQKRFYKDLIRVADARFSAHVTPRMPVAK